MNILFFNLVPEFEIGVRKKIKFQKKSLQKIGNFVSEITIKSNNIVLNNQIISMYCSKNNIFSIILRKIFQIILMFKLKKKEYYEKIDCIYLRYIKSTPFLLNYLKFLKKLNKKIVIEIPTYPYDLENLKENFFTKWDKKYRLELYKYVDKVVTFSTDEKIWNIPCINISNGIDLEEIKLIKKEKHIGINFISVSQCHFWHGIDRFLYSLLQYKKNNGKEKIKFHIVGEGSETPKLKKIVEDNIELQDIVIFHGFKLEEELDEVYNKSDVALSSLGEYRRGLRKACILKVREYCAKGIPFILGYQDDNFEKKLPFYYQVSNDESLLDIGNIIEWYKNLRTTPKEIRKYAEDNLTWDKQMKKIIDEIKKDEVRK